MEYTIEKKDTLIQEAQITIPASEVAPLITEKLKQFRKYVTLPGFRKGKAPLEIVRTRYLKDAEEEVFDDLINQKFSEIAEQENLKIVGRGVLRHIEWQPQDALHAVVEFQLQPEIKIQKLDGLKIEKPVYEVTDEEVEETFQLLREQQAVVKTVTDGAKPGHIIHADFQETDEKGLPIIGKQLPDRKFQLGTGNFGEQFDNQLLGVKEGDERNVVVTWESSPGQLETEYYKVKVKKVEEKVLPEPDDEFASSVGNFKNVEELRNDIRRRLEQDRKKRSEDMLKENIINELLKTNPFEVPPVMVDMYLEEWVERLKKETKEPINEEELRKRNRHYAIRNIRWYLLREEILKQEKLDIGDEDMDAYFEDLARQANLDKEALQKYYSKKENRDDLMALLEDRKIFERVLQTAEIVEVKVPSAKSNEANE